MAAEPKLQIPVLTDAIDRAPVNEGAEARSEPQGHGAPDALHGIDREALIAELQTQIAAGAFALTDDILRSAFAEMEATIFERITSRLRSELPEMIDELLRERLGAETDY